MENRVPDINLLPLSSKLTFPLSSLQYWAGTPPTALPFCQLARLEESVAERSWPGPYSAQRQLSAPVAAPPVNWLCSPGQAARSRPRLTLRPAGPSSGSLSSFLGVSSRDPWGGSRFPGCLRALLYDSCNSNKQNQNFLVVKVSFTFSPHRTPNDTPGDHN